MLLLLHIRLLLLRMCLLLSLLLLRIRLLLLCMCLLLLHVCS